MENVRILVGRIKFTPKIKVGRIRVVEYGCKVKLKIANTVEVVALLNSGYEAAYPAAYTCICREESRTLASDRR